MKSNKKISILYLLLLSASLSVYSQKDTTEIFILHTNDMHAKIDNFSKLAFIVDQYRKQYDNVFLFSAGDMFTGNPIVDQHPKPGFPIIDLMNKIGYDISCIGNHEFDYGQEILNKHIEESSFPYLSANIQCSNQSILKQPKDYFKLYTTDSLSIGILGLLQVDKNNIPATNPVRLDGLTFYDPFEIVENYEHYKDSSDVFIGLTHLGIIQDKKLAKKFPYFDVIIGGHSHTVLQTGININNTLIVHAGSNSNYLGVLILKLTHKEIISKSEFLININDSTQKNKDIESTINNYNQDPRFDEIIGTAKQDINGENELGALMSDAIRDTLEVDIAFQNNGGIRLDKIYKGDISIKQIYELSPFGNTYVVYNLNRCEIKRLIRYVYNISYKNELQVSGININLIIGKENKLRKIQLQNYDGSKLKKQMYSTAINDYMAVSYKLRFLKSGKNEDINDVGNLIRFIKKIELINYEGTHRVKLVTNN